MTELPQHAAKPLQYLLNPEKVVGVKREISEIDFRKVEPGIRRQRASLGGYEAARKESLFFGSCSMNDLTFDLR